MVLLKGDTGRGKTTILESIFYALYGTLRDQYSHNETTCSVTIHLQPDIVIQRCSGPGRLSLTYGNRTYKNGTEAQEIINSIFGTESVFLAGSYLIQGERCALLTGTNAEKMELLRTISFRGQHSQEAQSRTTAAIKSNASKMIAAETEFIISRRTLDNFLKENAGMEDVNFNIEDLNIDTLVEDIKSLKTALTTVESKYKKVIQLEAQIQVLTSEINKTTLVFMEENLEVDNLQADVDSREKKIADLMFQIKDFEIKREVRASKLKERERFEALRSKLQELDSKWKFSDATFETEMIAFSANQDALNKMKRDLEEFGVTKVGELRSKMGEMTSKIEDGKTLLQELQADLEAKIWNEEKASSLYCPGCNAQVSYENKKLKLLDQSAKFEPRPVKNQDVTLAMVEQKRREVDDLEVKKNKLQANIATLTKISMTLKEETPEDVQRFQAGQERRILKLQLNTLSNGNFETSEVEVVQDLDIASLQSEIMTLRNQIKETQDKITTWKVTRTQIEKHRETKLRLEGLKSELGDQTSSALEAEIANLKVKLEEAKEMHTLAVNIIKKVEIQADFDRKKRTLDQLQQRNGKLREMLAHAKQTDIAILERTVESLNKQVNHLLNAMFPEERKMVVSFSTTKETEKGDERMTCSMTIFYNNVYYKNYKRLSGGEGDRLSMAVMLAINILTDGKFILLDETLKTLDSASRLRVLEVIRTVVEGKKRCLIAAHDITEGSFDSILNF